MWVLLWATILSSGEPDVIQVGAPHKTFASCVTARDDWEHLVKTGRHSFVCVRTRGEPNGDDTRS